MELYEQELRRRLKQVSLSVKKVLSCTEMEVNEGEEKMIFMELKKK